jgi:hypothetical protein
MLHRLPSASTACWQGWKRLRAKLGPKFYAAFDAVSRAMARTPRSSSLVENLSSRLRNYFTLRRRLGGPYLDLLRFFLNHPFHAQPAARAQRQKPARVDDGPMPFVLAHPAGPGSLNHQRA